MTEYARVHIALSNVTGIDSPYLSIQTLSTCPKSKQLSIALSPSQYAYQNTYNLIGLEKNYKWVILQYAAMTSVKHLET